MNPAKNKHRSVLTDGNLTTSYEQQHYVPEKMQRFALSAARVKLNIFWSSNAF
jgi:hypothetical protein